MDSFVTFLVFPSSGGAATEHKAHVAVVEPSGALAIYRKDEGGREILMQAFASGAWLELRRNDA